MPKKRPDFMAAQQARLLKRIKALNPGASNDLANMLGVGLDWYRVVNSTDSKSSAEVYVYDEIGGWLGAPVDELIQEIMALDVDQIDVRINSPGGSVFDAIALYNTLVRHPANVTTYVDALAASAASIVAMAGDNVVMMVGGQMMIHDAMGLAFGNAADMKDMSNFLGEQSDNIASIYAARAGGEMKDWRALMLAESWYMADAAVEIGLADEVYKPGSQEAEADPDVEPEAAEGEEPAEESTPPKETPGPEEGEPPAEEPDTDDDEDESDLDDELADLMSRQHSLIGRGYKYPGARFAKAAVRTPANRASKPKGFADFYGKGR